MKKFIPIFSILTVILGLAVVAMGTGIEYGISFVSFGSLVAFIGIAIIVVGQMNPGFGKSQAALIVSIIACVGGGLLALEAVFALGGADTTGLMLAGVILSALSFILCPCLCIQNNERSKSNIIGIAAAHESISIDEISQKTGLSASVVSSVLYEAIGKGKISGRMEGDTFKRTGPASRAAHGAKVLVICQYCGAKTEQGLTKCQKCGADI